MSNLYLLRPEVAGGFGEKTVIENQRELKLGLERKANITKLEYVFDDWLGDDLITSSPCFIVTEQLARAVQETELSGYVLNDLLVSKSDLYDQIKGDMLLPRFIWMKVLGKAELSENWEVVSWSNEDFCLDERGRLIVTEKAINVLKNFSLENCEINKLNNLAV